jgi:hypothetical protein
MKYLFTLFIVISIGCNSQPPSVMIEKIATPIIDSFFSSIKAGRVKDAMEKLIESNPNFDKNDSTTISLIQNLVATNDASGSYMGNRLLKKRLLGDDIGLYIYLVKYEKRFYRFVFTFYNNGKTVKLNKFQFDDYLVRN